MEDSKPGYLERFQDAAGRGDATAAIEALYDAHVLDGCVRYLESRWSFLKTEDANLIASEAMTRLYEQVRSGKAIPKPQGLLYKIAWRLAHDAFENHQRRKNAIATYTAEHDFATDKTVEETRRRKRVEALRAARALLPTLGQTNVQRVMTYVLDAIEAERFDVPIAEIAEVLDLTADTARKSLDRGFERLERAVRQSGLQAIDNIRIADETVVVDTNEPE